MSKEQVGIYLPCYDIFRNWLEATTSKNLPGATPYVPLVAGALARSLACATCYPIELARTRMQVMSTWKHSLNIFSMLLVFWAEELFLFAFYVFKKLSWFT